MPVNSPTAVALIAYISLIFILTLVIILWRAGLTMSGARRSNSFTPSGADVAPWYQRLCRAHANCYEHFPIFGGLLLLALATQNTQLTNATALYWLAARLGQTLVHLASNRSLVVNVRFSFFLTQMLIALYWIYSFCRL